jgi:hypothetical protein
MYQVERPLQRTRVIIQPVLLPRLELAVSTQWVVVAWAEWQAR